MCLHESKRQRNEILVYFEGCVGSIEKVDEYQQFEPQWKGNTKKPFVKFETPYTKVKLFSCASLINGFHSRHVPHIVTAITWLHETVQKSISE